MVVEKEARGENTLHKEMRRNPEYLGRVRCIYEYITLRTNSYVGIMETLASSTM